MYTINLDIRVFGNDQIWTCNQLDLKEGPSPEFSVGVALVGQRGADPFIKQVKWS